MLAHGAGANMTPGRRRAMTCGTFAYRYKRYCCVSVCNVCLSFFNGPAALPTGYMPDGSVFNGQQARSLVSGQHPNATEQSYS